MYFLDDAFEAPNSSFEVACLACRLLSALSCYCIFYTGFYIPYAGLRLAVMLRLVLNSTLLPPPPNAGITGVQHHTWLNGSTFDVISKKPLPDTGHETLRLGFQYEHMLLHVGLQSICVKSYMRQWLEFMVLHVKGLIFLI